MNISKVEKSDDNEFLESVRSMFADKPRGPRLNC